MSSFVIGNCILNQIFDKQRVALLAGCFVSNPNEVFGLHPSCLFKHFGDGALDLGVGIVQVDQDGFDRVLVQRA